MTLTSDVKFIIGVLVATIIVIGGGAYLTSKKTSAPANKIVSEALAQHLVREDSPVLGITNAKVTVVEFGDFQCPACGVLHSVLKEIKNQYADKNVRFIFRQYPLSQHEHAFPAATASLVAHKQGKFWEYHNSLFEHQNNLNHEDLVAYAKNVGLDMENFEENFDDNAHADTIGRDITDGNALGVNSTPTLFINNIQYGGKYSVTDIAAVIDSELAK